MASMPIPGRFGLKKEPSTPNAKEEEDFTPTLQKGKEVMSTATERRRSEPARINLVSNSDDKNRTINFDELTERGLDALKRPDFTKAVHYFERALRIRISDEAKSGTESIKTMLKYADAWFVKGREISESSDASPHAAADIVQDLRMMLKNMTQTLTTEILQNIPVNSAERNQILSILAEADAKTKDEAISECYAVVDRLRRATRRILNAPVVPDGNDIVVKKIFHLSDKLDKEFGALASLYQVNQAAGSSNPRDHKRST